MNKPIIVIPVYKPDDALLTLVKNLSLYFTRIVIVDDGSGPEYTPLFDKLNIDQHQITLLRHYVNLGKGRALKTAFNYCLTSNWAWGGGQERLR